MPPAETLLDHLAAAQKERASLATGATGGALRLEWAQRGCTHAVLSPHWPTSVGGVPFSRVFGFRAQPACHADELMEGIVARGLDVIVETMPGPDEEPAARALRRFGYQLAWQVPWYGMGLDRSVLGLQVGTTKPTASEAERLAAIDVLLAAYAYPPPEAALWRTLYSHGLRSGANTVFATVHQGQPAGAALLHVRGDTALVDGAAVLPEHRGHGLHRALLGARLIKAFHQGARFAFSRTGDGSVSAVNLTRVGMSLMFRSTAWRRVSGLVCTKATTQTPIDHTLPRPPRDCAP